MHKWTIALLAPAFMLFAACGDDDDAGDDVTETPFSTTGAPATIGATTTTGGGECRTLSEPASAGDLTWEQILPAQLPDMGEYSVEDTEGDAPLVNALQGGDVVGTVELLQFPTAGNIDTTQPAADALAEWARRFYDDVAPEREAAGGTLAGDAPAEANFGTACGIQYGYTVTDEGDAVIERYAGYATFDSEKMYLTVALYDAAIADEQGFGSAEALAGFEPGFARLIAALAFPPE